MILRKFQIESFRKVMQEYISSEKFSVLDLGGDKLSPFYELYSNLGRNSIVNLFPETGADILLDLEKINSLENILNPDEHFNLCICFNVIEHLYNPVPCIELLKSMVENNRVDRAIIFIPFLHKYHPSPKDYLRLTSDYWNKAFLSDKIKLSLVQHGGSPLLLIISILLQKRIFRKTMLSQIFYKIILSIVYYVSKGNKKGQYPLGYQIMLEPITN